MKLLPILAAWSCPLVIVAAESEPVRPGPTPEMTEKVDAAKARLDAWRAADDVPGERTMKVVYWTPADRDPAPGYRERLSRVMLEVRDFYLGEMKRLGLGERTIGLEMVDETSVKIHVVKGGNPYAEYQVDSGRAIRDECRQPLAEAGIDIDKETVVLFCNMSNWDPEKKRMTQNSPYYASGNWMHGCAWQVDSPLLDPALLAETRKMLSDGQYGQISHGRYNSIFIGGVIHELGHALGLPHCGECEANRKTFGTALMGWGNRTFGEERRGEGPGTFLELAHALKLASHPQFSRSLKGFGEASTRTLSERGIAPTDDGQRVSYHARIRGTPGVYLAIGYFDPAGGRDYDAQITCAVPDEDGRFTLESPPLRPDTRYQARIVFVHVSGDASAWQSPRSDEAFDFRTDARGVPELGVFRASELTAPAFEHLERGDRAAARSVLDSWQDGPVAAGHPEVVAALGNALVEVDRAPRPSALPDEVKSTPLAVLKPETAGVGWGRPTYNRIPGAGAVMLGGEWFTQPSPPGG